MSAEAVETIWGVVAPLILAVLGWAAKKLADFINAKVKNEYLANTLTRLDYAVVNAVKEINQTTVEAMKTAKADGKIEPHEVEQIKKAALEKAKSYLDLDELAKILGLKGSAEVDAVIGSRIESAVHDLKTAKATTKALASANP